MKKFLLYFLLSIFCAPLHAQVPDFKEYFEIDLDSPLPNMQQLREEYNRAAEVYDPRYIVSWELGGAFDDVWRSVISYYGTTEKRLRASGEEELFDTIASLPKEVYPYIGPLLHSVPGIPEKILNMPGIKETKNKFPERIAPQLADIEDLEFLSPYLYILLMPEMWPENNKSVELPQQRRAKIPQTPYNPEFYAKVLQNVEENGIGSAYKSAPVPLPDRLRTLNVTKTSPLTAADVVAFINTLDGVLKFDTFAHKYQIMAAGSLLDYFEAKNGTALDMNTLKDIVNPCQRLAQKIKWAGLETEFSKNIAKEGFNLKEWAYTCDKTIKAYRTTLISEGKLASLKLYKKGVYNAYLMTLKEPWRNRQFATMQGVLEMYRTNRNDVNQVLKNRAELQDKLLAFGAMFVTSPLSLN